MLYIVQPTKYHSEIFRAQLQIFSALKPFTTVFVPEVYSNSSSLLESFEAETEAPLPLSSPPLSLLSLLLVLVLPVLAGGTGEEVWSR